jgi:hypothetical protein
MKCVPLFGATSRSLYLRFDPFTAIPERAQRRNGVEDGTCRERANSREENFEVQPAILKVRSAFTCAIFARSSSESGAESMNETAGAVGWKG